MWPFLASTAVGLWLMAAPAVLGYGRPAADVDHVVGPIAASFAFISVWEATRGLRWLNVPLGLWLLAAPWVLGYEGVATWNSLVVGALLIGLAFLRGKRKEQFGGGWATLLPGRGAIPPAE